jgi:hypothetical protein
MPRSFQRPRALQLEGSATTIVDDERHQEGVEIPQTIYGSYVTAACGVSNDPPDEGELVDLTVCNVTRYRCSPASDIIPTVVDVQISYDYEIRYNPASVFARVLPFVEESILESLAAVMNLKRCPGTNRRQLRRLQDDFSETQRGRFIGVSLLPRDFQDDRFTSCLPGDGDSVADANSECRPIKGGMTVSLALSEEEQEGLGELPEEDVESIRFGVWNFIERSMGEDAYVVPGNIDGVTFVGNRQVIADDGLVAEENTEDDGGLSGVGKGVLSGALPFFFILLLLGLVVRRRRPKHGADKYNSRPVDLMPGLMVMPEEHEHNWHTRSTGAASRKLSPGSLAFTDSLALEPQFIIEDEISAKPPRSPSRSIQVVEVEEEGQELREEDFAAHHINVIEERAAYHIDMLEENSSQDSLFDIDEGDEDFSEGTNSEFTPRRTLQMT